MDGICCTKVWNMLYKSVGKFLYFAGQPRGREGGMKTQKKAAIVIFALLMALISTSAYAQEAASDADEWKFKFTTGFAFVGMEGDATLSGVTGEFDLSFSDLLDNFDVFGLNASLEAWKGDWGYFVNGAFTDLNGDFDFKLIEPEADADIAVDIRQTSLELGLIHRLCTVPLGTARDASSGKRTPALMFALLGGGRYAYLKQELDITLAGPEIGRKSGTLGGSEDWVEPFVGGRIGLALTEKLTLVTSGDVGGFGIGTASDLTWKFFAGVDYRFLEWLSATAGYSIYDIDYERGSGDSKFGLDARIEGPAVALSFYF